MLWEKDESNILKTTWDFGENLLKYFCISMGWGNSYPFALEIMEGGLDYGKRKCDNYCRLGSAWIGRSIAPFFQRVKSYFIQFITNQLPETGRIMPWLRLFAFAGRMVVWYWSPNHDRQIELFRLNLLSSPACPLSEEEIADRIILEEWKWRRNF